MILKNGSHEVGSFGQINILRLQLRRSCNQRFMCMRAERERGKEKEKERGVSAEKRRITKADNLTWNGFGAQNKQVGAPTVPLAFIASPRE
jgi:hypothetical protein